MIGPHQGKELELMLAGRKHLALFYDVFTDGHKNNEIIIPEESFKPYVDSGAILRHSRDITAAKDGTVITYVCFTLPGHAWRAEAFFWMKEECLAGRRPFDAAYEFFVGRLLDYEEFDIMHYIQSQGISLDLPHKNGIIGPHQGKELELMLSGQKHLATFSHITNENETIPQEILPDLAFYPYVENRFLKRHSKKIFSKKLQKTINCICFTLPDNGWRADTFFWAIEEGIKGLRPFDDAHEFLIGRILGYDERDITFFIQNLRSL